MLIGGGSSHGEEKQGGLWKGNGDVGHLAYGAERSSFRGRTKLFYKDRGTDHLEKREVDPGAARDKGLKEGGIISVIPLPATHSLQTAPQYCVLRHLHMETVNPSG